MVHRLATALWPMVLDTLLESRILLLEASAVRFYRILVRVSVLLTAGISIDASLVGRNSIRHFPRVLRHGGSRKPAGMFVWISDSPDMFDSSIKYIQTKSINT